MSVTSLIQTDLARSIPPPPEPPPPFPPGVRSRLLRSKLGVSEDHMGARCAGYKHPGAKTRTLTMKQKMMREVHFPDCVVLQVQLPTQFAKDPGPSIFFFFQKKAKEKRGTGRCLRCARVLWGWRASPMFLSPSAFPGFFRGSWCWTGVS